MFVFYITGNLFHFLLSYYSSVLFCFCQKIAERFQIPTPERSKNHSMSITLSRMASYTENVPCVCVCILFHFSQGSLFPKLVHMWLVLSHQQSLQIQRVRIILSVTFDSEMHNKHLKHITRVHTALSFQGHRLRILLPGFRGSFQILLPPHTYMSVRACTTALSYPGVSYGVFEMSH